MDLTIGQGHRSPKSSEEQNSLEADTAVADTHPEELHASALVLRGDCIVFRVKTRTLIHLRVRAVRAMELTRDWFSKRCGKGLCGINAKPETAKSR